MVKHERQNKLNTNEAPSKAPVIGVRNGWRTAGVVGLTCLWVLVSVVAVQFVVSFLMIKILGPERLERPVWSAAYSAIVYILAMGLIIAVPALLKKKLPQRKVVMKRGGDDNLAKKASTRKKLVQKKLMRTETRMELGLMGLPTWADIGLAPVGFMVSLILAAVLVGVFSVFPWFNAEEVQNVGFSIYMTGGDRVIAFLTLVVMAPVAEEIIFRGWLYGKMRNQLLGKMPEIWGIVLSTFLVSLVFGLVHMQWNVGVNVFALSVVLCALREVTGTIYAGILTHMIKNGVAFFLLYVIGVA